VRDFLRTQQIPPRAASALWCRRCAPAKFPFNVKQSGPTLICAGLAVTLSPRVIWTVLLPAIAEDEVFWKG